MKSIVFMFLAAVLSAFPAPQARADQPETLPSRDFSAKNITELTEELLHFNPELRALMEKIQAYEQRVPQAGALDDPRFEFALRNFQVRDFNPNADFMSGFEFGLRQMVPWPGKLGLKKKIAQSQAGQEKEEYLERVNQLVAKFKQTFYELRFVEEAAGIYRASLARFSGMNGVLEARYSTGKTLQQDVLNNKVEISKLRDILLALGSQEKALEARLTSLLNRPAGTPLEIRHNPSPLPALKATLEQLQKLATRHRPWLKKSDLQIAAADFQTHLAKKEMLPDFDFGAGYMIRTDGHPNPNDNRDMITLGFSMNLPFYAGKKQKKAYQEAVHMKKMEEYQKAATTQEILYQVEEVYLDLKKLNAQLALLNSQTLPQSSATVDSAQVNYGAEKTDFSEVLMGEINLLEQRLQRSRYRYEYAKKIAELEMATGLPLKILNEFAQSEDGIDAK